jgi:hypothetical protein|nr:MAG TPA: hypothetical protein [Caudoviricetes sp.]
MKEIHAFEATRIAKENARLNKTMDEIFKTIRNNAYLGMFYAEIASCETSVLNDLEMSICIRRLEALSYKVEKTNKGLNIKWGED